MRVVPGGGIEGVLKHADLRGASDEDELRRSPLDDYYDRAGQLAATDVAGWLALGRWASDQGLSSHAREAYTRVLATAPDDAEANQALGRVSVDGRWMTEADGCAWRYNPYARRPFDRRFGRATMPQVKLILAIVWILIAAVVFGYPLLAGHIRMGGPGSDPITREGDPGGFWTAYAISSGLFALMSAGVAWFVLSKLP